ncbi:hypothetical protein C4S57_5130 [Saccharomyces cerevisiae]|nr:basic amino acid transporter [Saccharomyces cerevisiae]PTN25959.1 hypothetical protein C4S57_5130 [Saccharomyces cerevisiae]
MNSTRVNEARQRYKESPIGESLLPLAFNEASEPHASSISCCEEYLVSSIFLNFYRLSSIPGMIWSDQF